MSASTIHLPLEIVIQIGNCVSDWETFIAFRQTNRMLYRQYRLEYVEQRFPLDPEVESFMEVFGHCQLEETQSDFFNSHGNQYTCFLLKISGTSCHAARKILDEKNPLHAAIRKRTLLTRLLQLELDPALADVDVLSMWREGLHSFAYKFLPDSMKEAATEPECFQLHRLEVSTDHGRIDMQWHELALTEVCHYHNGCQYIDHLWDEIDGFLYGCHLRMKPRKAVKAQIEVWHKFAILFVLWFRDRDRSIASRSVIVPEDLSEYPYRKFIPWEFIDLRYDLNRAVDYFNAICNIRTNVIKESIAEREKPYSELVDRWQPIYRIPEDPWYYHEGERRGWYSVYDWYN